MEQLTGFFGQYFLEVAAGLAIAAIAWFRVQIWNAFLLWSTSIQRIRQAQQAIRSDRPWTIRPPERSATESSIPIITVANLKGGVGKTTLTANLAALFATEYRRRPPQSGKRRILVIDLDFQGSASSMLLSREDRIPKSGQLSDASNLLLGELKLREVIRSPKAAIPDGVRVVPAYYDLARTETRLQLQWLIGDERDDIRFRLREILLSPEIQEAFDLVLIDAPPRLTTGTIVALCASTHLIIPTILDVVSGEAVGSFLDQIEELRELWPSLSFLGVIGTMVATNPKLKRLRTSESDGEIAVQAAIDQVYKRHNLNPPADAMFPRDTYVVDSELIRERSGTVWFVDLGEHERAREVKDLFRKLASEIEKRLEVSK